MDIDDIVISGTQGYLQGIFIHEIFACLLLLPYIAYLYVLFLSKTFLQLNHKVFLIMPITLLLLSVALSSGIFLLAMRGFESDIKIASMIMLFIIFISGEIYRIRTLRKSKTSRQGMQKYVKQCKIIYITFLMLHIACIAWYKLAL
ncbi:hypothetical protein LS73_006065 [Helicobacter muridarum]|uniref:TerC family integral membrane protein n=1 Tax=Helicobacter muridarum TaxID=216 RepID=A0A377PX36_9HELI|nr:hypothetical protein [Helicobacter muridarum]TLD99997.1 hypothetical protein LS73_006065 [Helicobacter muridarum]STQ87070.1 TerC family integral membrane protein [Helicobacter muridarum]